MDDQSEKKKGTPADRAKPILENLLTCNGGELQKAHSFCEDQEDSTLKEENNLIDNLEGVKVQEVIEEKENLMRDAVLSKQFIESS